MLQLPRQEASIWREAYPQTMYPKLESELEADVAIIGAGITGLTSAYLLKQSGLKVVVLDKDTIGGGTTGRTTGKVTSLHSLTYHDMQARLGQAVAKSYAEANQTAVDKVAAIIKQAKIDCDWESGDNYTFTGKLEQVHKFKQEAETAKGLGLPAAFVTKTPLPFDVKGAVKFSGQGKLHAQKYLLGLAKAVNGGGSRVFEHTKALGIRDGRPGRVKTPGGRLAAKHIIVATAVPSLPLMARGTYCFLEYPTESYIVAGPLERPISGMYISPDEDNYSILPKSIGGKGFLLVGGVSRLPVNKFNQMKRYQTLADYAEKHFGLRQITHRWSDRDYQTYDGPPLVGRLYPWSKNLYVATAYRKWGLSNGTAAAMILHDLILAQPNAWADTYSPNRKTPLKYIPKTALEHLKL